MDERIPLSSYLRRDVLKATAVIGASIVLTGKAVATEQVNAAEEQHKEPIPHDEKGSTMPLVRIDLNKDAPVERIRAVSQAIYNAMIEIADVPPHDRFMVFNRHATDEIIYPEEGYLGLTYTRDLIIIQITWVSGRSTDVKRKFFHRIADEIHEKAGVRKEDVWISLSMQVVRIGLLAMVRCNTDRSEERDTRSRLKNARPVRRRVGTRAHATAQKSCNNSHVSGKATAPYQRL